MSTPFVGRVDELEALTNLVPLSLRKRRAVAALVRGEPGSGKTRLLAEAIRRSRPPHVVRLAGFEAMQQVPLAAAGDLLRVLSRAPGGGVVLDRLLFGQPEDQARDPLRIFEAAHRALAASGPFVVVIDDLQWADQGSVALVHYLLRSAASGRQPLVVLAAARPSPAAAAFRSALGADIETEHRLLIELGPLPFNDGRTLVRAIDDGLDDSASADLWRRAGGSPFWLEALARGRSREDPAHLLDERLRDLTPDAGTLLAALAVATRPLGEEEVALLLEWEADRTRSGSRELVARGLALDAAGTIRPAHDLIREATTASLPAATRRRLHARLAEWIEAGAGDDLPRLREALEHRVAAGLPVEDLSIRLLTSPRRRMLGVEGLKLVTSISDGLRPGSSAQVDIDRSIGELAGALGEPALALERWKRVAAHAEDPAERRQASIEAARAAYRLRQADEARANLDRARAHGVVSPAAEVAMTALEAEIQLWLDHATAAGAETAERSLAAALQMTVEAGGLERLSPEARRASLAAHDVAIDAALQQERADDVLRLSEASVAVAEGLDTESHLSSIIRPAFGLRPLGRAREAEARYRRVWLLAQEHILPAQMVEAGHGLARVLRDLGRLEEARDVAAQTIELERRIGHPPRRWGNAPSILHLTELALGDSSRIQSIQADARSEMDPHYRLAVYQLVAAWQARLHGSQLAAAVKADLAAAREAATLAGCPRCSRELSVFTAESLARIGSVDEAARELDAWERQSTSDYLMRRIWRSRARAAIALARGEEAAAAELLEASLYDMRREGLVDDLLWALLDLGAALTAISRERAINAFTEAAQVAENTGARTQGRLATQALRRLGVRAWRRGRAAAGEGTDALSDREREVAGLLADGMSNREIAEALALSPKTVERHVTNILAKLGARNRTQVASLVRTSTVRGSPDADVSLRR